MKQTGIHRTSSMMACCLLILSIPLMAQEKVQVASKTISREYSSECTSITLTAEKSDIILYMSPDEKIRVEIKLISKSPDRQTAIDDLKIIGYEIKEDPGAIAIRNYFQPSGDKPVKSNLSVKYNLYLPASVNARINCLYSKVTMQAVNSNCTINAGFSDLTVSRCEGHITLRSYYCGISIEEGNAILSGSLDKSDLSLTNYAGPVDMTTNYGQITVTQFKSCSGIRFTGSYSEYNLTAQEELLKNCQLTTISGTIDTPAAYKNQIKTEKNKTTLILQNDVSANPILISTTYNTIRLYETK
jgi:hypothetical protein